MIVRLVRDEHRRRAGVPSGWLLAAADPAAWVAEIARWDDCQHAARVLVLPDGLGAVVILAESHAGQAPAGLRGIPYQRTHRLYFPADARLFPPLSSEDVEEWFADGIAVLHPVAGLIRFRSEDALPVTAFLEPPAVLPVRWNMARPGNAPRPRLASVTLKPGHESMQSFLDEGRGDIGRTPLHQAPAHAGEKTESPGLRASHKLKEQFYKAVEKLAGQAPEEDAPRRRRSDGRQGTRGGGSFLQRLGQWAGARLEQIESAQKREIDRLLHLLRTDPDAGLRYAPPLHSSGIRGRSDSPPASLVERDTEFNLGALGGGRPAAPWRIDIGAYEQLRREYREAANRELRLHRFRRAAYIYAHLLEDHATAADALASGRHYREAALLYRDHAGRPLEAAECFWEAGDFENAEPLFAESGKFARLGELYAAAGRDSASRAAYRKAADQAMQMKDVIAASRILDRHLGECDEAIRLLREAWPFSEQAGDCVREEFALLARLQRHADARARLPELIRACPSRRELGPPLIESLGRVAADYPAADVCSLAADLARVETGRRIEGLSANEAARVLAVMRSLSPADRLLLRDTQRFLTTRKRHLLPAPPPRPQGSIDLKLYNIISLPDDADWIASESFPGGYYAVGARENTLVLIRKKWLGRRIDIAWPYAFSHRKCSLTVTPGLPHIDPAVQVHSIHPLEPAFHPLHSDTGESRLLAGSLQRAGSGHLGLTFTPDGNIWELSVQEDAMVLKCHRAGDHHVLATAHTASLFGENDPESIGRRAAPVPMTCIDGQVFFAFRSFLCRYHEGGFAWLELPDAVTELRSGVSCGQPVIAAAMAVAGVAVVSCGRQWGAWEHHAPDADACRIRFLRDGLLAVANTRLFELYRTDPRAGATDRCARENVKLPNLLGILPADEPDAVVLMSSLQSHYYRMVEA